jgi:ubiquinone/menaquinone biosynthesis C-methylase UbiE
MEAVRALYTELALHPGRDFGWGKGKENARSLGYDERWLDRLPAFVWESAAAVGNPFRLGPIMPGETVVDLGCGAGADLCIAALLVGNHGRAIGIDITPAMVAKAEKAARLVGLTNVTFHVADIAMLPLNNASVDVAISNGAPLARMVRHVIAIDIDLEMLDAARAKVAAAGVANCEFVAGDAYAIADLIRRPVDFVLMANTFHGVPDKPQLARAVAAILKPGGRFAVVNWHRRPRDETIVLGQPRGPKTEMRMRSADVVTTVEPAGLKLAGVIELPPYHYGAIFEKPAA